MSLLVVGSMAIDGVHTPKGVMDECLGGSASFFSIAASYFSPVRLVSVVGEDFPDAYFQVFAERSNIDTAGVLRAMGKTFRWKGKYSPDMNARDTLEVHLNVFGAFDPDLPDSYRDSQFLFLANGSPVVQRKVLHQAKSPKLVVCDTMDLWIETQHDELVQLLKQVDGIVLNDSEALLLTQEDLLINAGKKVLAMGPRFVVIKKGEHGCILLSAEGVVSLPAYPTSQVVDPTGAGDCFAGGMMGYLATANAMDATALKRAVAYGTVTASICVEDFSLNRLRATTREELEQRYRLYQDMLRLG